MLGVRRSGPTGSRSLMAAVSRDHCPFVLHHASPWLHFQPLHSVSPSWLLLVREFELPVLLGFGDREPRLHILPANLGFLICEVKVITPTLVVLTQLTARDIISRNLLCSVFASLKLGPEFADVRKEYSSFPLRELPVLASSVFPPQIPTRTKPLFLIKNNSS